MGSRVLVTLDVVGRIFIFLLIFNFGQNLWAAETERLGRFEISEFSLSPRLRLQEPGTGGFELSESWIGFEWTRDEDVRGVLKLGSSDLSAPAIWYTPQVRPSFGVSEAWMEGRSLYGDVRAGLLVVPQGFEGISPEWDSVLPETRARRKSWFVKRDFGLQFRWQRPHWDTSITVHNGESGDNLDGKYWVSGHWRYKDSDGNGALATAGVGQTKSIATSGSNAALPENGFVFDPNADAKIRQTSLAIFRENKRNLFLIEAGKGEILQNEETNSFFWGHCDLVWNWGGDASLLARYEQDQPNQKDSSTIVKSSGLGFSLSSHDNLQSLTVFANHIEEKPEVPSDELWMIFRIHSSFLQ